MNYNLGKRFFFNFNIVRGIYIKRFNYYGTLGIRRKNCKVCFSVKIINFQTPQKWLVIITVSC